MRNFITIFFALFCLRAIAGQNPVQQNPLTTNTMAVGTPGQVPILGAGGSSVAWGNGGGTTVINNFTITNQVTGSIVPFAGIETNCTIGGSATSFPLNGGPAFSTSSFGGNVTSNSIPVAAGTVLGPFRAYFGYYANGGSVFTPTNVVAYIYTNGVGSGETLTFTANGLQTNLNTITMAIDSMVCIVWSNAPNTFSMGGCTLQWSLSQQVPTSIASGNFTNNTTVNNVTSLNATNSNVMTAPLPAMFPMAFTNTPFPAPSFYAFVSPSGNDSSGLISATFAGASNAPFKTIDNCSSNFNEVNTLWTQGSGFISNVVCYIKAGHYTNINSMACPGWTFLGDGTNLTFINVFGNAVGGSAQAIGTGTLYDVETNGMIANCTLIGYTNVTDQYRVIGADEIPAYNFVISNCTMVGYYDVIYLDSVAQGNIWNPVMISGNDMYVYGTPPTIDFINPTAINGWYNPLGSTYIASFATAPGSLLPTAPGTTIVFGGSIATSSTNAATQARFPTAATFVGTSIFVSGQNKTYPGQNNWDDSGYAFVSANDTNSILNLPGAQWNLTAFPTNYYGSFAGSGSGTRGSFGLVNAAAKTILAQCILSARIQGTNNFQMWLTNITSGDCRVAGESGGLALGVNTNDVELTMPCNGGDSVEVTNMGTISGVSGGAIIINSRTNTIF